MVDMDIVNEEPLYNIGVVSRMTGISMATLRAWERRYKFPDFGAHGRGASPVFRERCAAFAVGESPD